MTKPSAKIVLDSVSPSGDRLTTMEVVTHRFVLAEFNTHRVFSRNSASSRAIPVAKQLERVMNDPAYPVAWPAERPGMQGGESLSDEEIEWARDAWHHAMLAAVEHAKHLTQTSTTPLHKSVANRLLEPFMWHTVVVSSTEWDNFFGLRCNPLAQPEIQAAAYAMRDALEASTPTLVGYGEWHMPYLRPEDWQGEVTDCPEHCVKMRKVSAARCARVSYLTQDGVRDIEKDLELYERLTSAYPPHSSPLEHVATPWPSDHVHEGNFSGWVQLRHTIEREMEEA